MLIGFHFHLLTLQNKLTGVGRKKTSFYSATMIGITNIFKEALLLLFVIIPDIVISTELLYYKENMFYIISVLVKITVIIIIVTSRYSFGKGKMLKANSCMIKTNTKCPC